MKKKLPRHAGGSFELKEGTGPITAMCPCGEFLEIYKVDKTFRVKTPEGVDPEEINPNAPFTASPIDDIGSSNPIVARVLLQSHEILKSASFEGPVNKEAVTIHLHSCKESLIASEKTAKRVASHIDRIIEEVNKNGISSDSGGRTLNPFPQVPDLEADCGNFLIHANRAIKLIAELPQFFLTVDRVDSNFEHLGKRLTATIGDNLPLTQFVVSTAASVRHLIDLRNYHEHPKIKKTIITNFTLMPDLRVRVPMWYVSDQEARPVKNDMLAALEFLTKVTEAMFLHLVMYKISNKFPYIIEEIPEKEINSASPIKYRLTLDASKLRFQQTDNG
jgi:hypothetical protein